MVSYPDAAYAARGRGPHLGPALALSFVAHLLVLWVLAMPGSENTLPLPQTLRVSVQDPATAGARAAETPPAEQTDDSEHRPPREQAVDTAGPAAQTAAPPSEARPDEQTGLARPVTPASAGDAPVDRAAVESEIIQAMRSRFTYPALARRRGWEGSVVLRLDLDSEGRLQHIAVEQSSGHRILDRAALDALKALSGRVPVASDINQPLNGLRIPVEYRLQG